MSAQTVIPHVPDQGERVSVFDLKVGDRAAVVWGSRVVPFVVLAEAASSQVRVKIAGEFRNGDVVYVHALERVVSIPAPPRGVPLAKAGDTVHVTPRVLVMDMGHFNGYSDVVTRVRVNLVKPRPDGWAANGTVCNWCCGDDTVPAMYTAEHADGWTDGMCRHHAMVYGRFVPAWVLRHVAGWVDSPTAAYIEDWGFTESV